MKEYIAEDQERSGIPQECLEMIANSSTLNQKDENDCKHELWYELFANDLVEIFRYWKHGMLHGFCIIIDKRSYPTCIYKGHWANNRSYGLWKSFSPLNECTLEEYDIK